MTMLANFRECARLWFDGELTQVQTTRLTNDLYGYLRMLDMRTDERPADGAAWQEYRDVQRVWNSMVIENRRLAQDAQDRIGPDYRPDCINQSAWSPLRAVHVLECCGCDHQSIVEYRVRGPDGEIRTDCTIEWRTHSTVRRNELDGTATN